MKKRLAKVVAVVSVLTMIFSATVFAAPSTSTTTTDANTTAVVTTPSTAVSSTTVDGVKVTIAAVSQSVLNSAASFGATLGNGASMLFCVDVVADKGGVATFNSPAITAGMKLKAGHQKADGSWEEYQVTEVGNGYVKIKCPGFSPIAVYVVGASPKTGEAMPVAMLVAVAAFAAAGVCVKKSRFEK